jgi:pimeloyl-ACP methyl ester carboxylesterase
VVLEPGAGLTSSAFGWITPAVARDTRVCVYDRAGRGWSEPADSRQDAAQIAADLHTLLERGDVPGPYVVAGHSFGGLYALTFAARYPEETAGMVLIDSTEPGSAATPAKSPDEEGSDDIMGRVSALLSSTARLGLGRLIAELDDFSLPPRARDEARASLATPRHLQSTIDEYMQGGASADQAASLTDFGDKPLAVVTAGSGSDAAWMEAQEDLASLSTNSTHRVIDGAAHSDLVLEKDAAAATSQAILDVVASVRSARRLVR